jgi:hypothetical protein
MTEQKESDATAPVQSSSIDRRMERRSTEERLRKLEGMVIDPDWVNRIQRRIAALEQANDELDANLLAAKERLLAVERVAGLTAQMRIPGQTPHGREIHDRQVMDEAISRRKEAEDRVRARTAERIAAAGA